IEEFLDLLEDKCNKMVSKKALFVGYNLEWRTRLSAKQKRMVLFSTLTDAALQDKSGKINYIKDALMAPLMGTSNSVKEFFSSLNLCYSPSTFNRKMNEQILEKLAAIKEELAKPKGEISVLKFDNFNRVHVQGTPGSANAGKFSKSQTQANLGPQLHPGVPIKVKGRHSLSPLPLLEGKPCINFHEKYANLKGFQEHLPKTLSSVSDAVRGRTLRSSKVVSVVPFNNADAYKGDTIFIPSEAYYDTWIERAEKNDAYSSKLYSYSMSTHARALKGFHVFKAVNYPMNSNSDITKLFKDIMTFTAGYSEAMWLVGDFYVRRNNIKVIWALDVVDPPPVRPENPTKEQLLASLGRKLSTKVPTLWRLRVFPWPDMMHIALNAQLALLRWAFTVIMPLWHAAFPNAVIDPVKIHSIRRVMILTLMLLAWKGARELVFKMHAALKDKWTDVQRVFIESLIRLFDEDMPLVLDASAALATGNVKLYKEVLICLLPMFIRLNKKNYVIIILFILTTMDQFEKSPADAKAAMKSFLAVASSEDLEVFNSLLRDAIRPYGSENAAVIKTLYVSVTQERSARAFLAEVACLKKKEKEQDPTAQYTHSFNLNEASPLQLNGMLKLGRPSSPCLKGSWVPHLG
ncbi:hypothetical protein DFS34DRAFT_606499, partial [Phlyctochytrium arcticum]